MEDATAVDFTTFGKVIMHTATAARDKVIGFIVIIPAGDEAWSGPLTKLGVQRRWA